MMMTLLRSFVAFGCVSAFVACASIPEVTFDDADGAVAHDGNASDPDGSSGSADGSSSGGDGASNSKDGSATKDSGAGAVDSGNPCGAGNGEICCGTKICHGCSASDCGMCASLGCTGTDVCCAKGVNITCRAPGTGGC